MKILVQDINDHAPVFLGTAGGDAGLTAHVPENAAPHYVITQVTATDKDEGMNARLR